ncbi:hypothetical protein PYCC9005_002037 [Savitreella phatthalungensis]
MALALPDYCPAPLVPLSGVNELVHPSGPLFRNCVPGLANATTSGGACCVSCPWSHSMFPREWEANRWVQRWETLSFFGVSAIGFTQMILPYSETGSSPAAVSQLWATAGLNTVSVWTTIRKPEKILCANEISSISAEMKGGGLCAAQAFGLTVACYAAAMAVFVRLLQLHLYIVWGFSPLGFASMGRSRMNTLLVVGPWVVSLGLGLMWLFKGEYAHYSPHLCFLRTKLVVNYICYPNAALALLAIPIHLATMRKMTKVFRAYERQALEDSEAQLTRRRDQQTESDFETDDENDLTDDEDAYTADLGPGGSGDTAWDHLGVDGHEDDRGGQGSSKRGLGMSWTEHTAEGLPVERVVVGRGKPVEIVGHAVTATSTSDADTTPSSSSIVVAPIHRSHNAPANSPLRSNTIHPPDDPRSAATALDRDRTVTQYINEKSGVRVDSSPVVEGRAVGTPSKFRRGLRTVQQLWLLNWRSMKMLTLLVAVSALFMVSMTVLQYQSERRLKHPERPAGWLLCVLQAGKEIVASAEAKGRVRNVWDSDVGEEATRSCEPYANRRVVSIWLIASLAILRSSIGTFYIIQTLARDRWRRALARRVVLAYRWLAVRLAPHHPPTPTSKDNTDHNANTAHTQSR